MFLFETMKLRFFSLYFIGLQYNSHFANSETIDSDIGSEVILLFINQSANHSHTTKNI